MDSWTLQQSWLGSLQILMYMLMFLLFKKQQPCVHNAFYYPCYYQGRNLQKIFYKEKQKEQKTNVKCMGCETYLCFQSDRNCLLSFHER